MKTKRIFFVAGIFVIALSCILVMNNNFNRLSRYSYTPYLTDEEISILDTNLTDKEIEYIIEWSIYPGYLLDYADKDGFSVFHIMEYDYLNDYHKSISDENIVKLVEATRDYLSVEKLAEWLNHYDIETVLFYSENGDVYNSDGRLATRPSASSTFLSNEIGVSTRVPYVLEQVTSIPTVNDPILVKDTIIEPLNQLCAAIEEDNVNPLPCAALSITEGYVSYHDQILIYEEALLEYGSEVLYYENYPGHDDSQLGWSVDFAVTGIVERNFDLTVQYKWLKENAHQFGFIELHTKEDVGLTNKIGEPHHWRYVGVEKATNMYENDYNYFE